MSKQQFYDETKDEAKGEDKTGEVNDETTQQDGEGETNPEDRAEGSEDTKDVSGNVDNGSAEVEDGNKGKTGSRKASATKARESKEKAAAKVSSSGGSTKPKGKKGKKIKEYHITLADSSTFPPGGLVLGKNGVFKRLFPEKPVWINQYWKEVLDHAVIAVPKRDPETSRIVGRRNVPRFHYTIDDVREVDV